ncbi:MAG: plasmid stabilization protein [Phycisphaerales bacterium]|nr:plasmid stabilization protein [Phycisphaerales bacterium]
MASLLIRNLPDAIHVRLKQRAARHRRSLSREALVILEASLKDAGKRPSLQSIDRRRVRGLKPLTGAILRRALSQVKIALIACVRSMRQNPGRYCP